MSGCGSTGTTTAPPTPAPPTAAPGANGIDPVPICAGTDYPGCPHDVSLLQAGSLIAVCQFPDHTGNIVVLRQRSDATSACTDGMQASRLVRVVQLP